MRDQQIKKNKTQKWERRNQTEKPQLGRDFLKKNKSNDADRTLSKRREKERGRVAAAAAAEEMRRENRYFGFNLKSGPTCTKKEGGYGVCVLRRLCMNPSREIEKERERAANRHSQNRTKQI